MDPQNSDSYLFPFPSMDPFRYPWELPQPYPDWTISDPSTGVGATLSQAVQVPRELFQSSWVPQIPPDQQTASLPELNIEAV